MNTFHEITTRVGIVAVGAISIVTGLIFIASIF